MSNANIFKLSIVVILVILVTTFALKLSSPQKSDSLYPGAYLIAGVPYESRLAGTPIANTGGMLTLALSKYYGISWVDPFEMNFAFPYAPGFSSNKNSDIRAIKDFFEFRVGYKGATSTITGVEDLKPYLTANLPVVVKQRLTLDTPEYVQTMRLAIGYSDTDQTITFHDVNFGNNFVVSYTDFNALNQGGDPQMLVIYPEESFVNTANTPYPARLGIMDDPEIRAIQIAWVTGDVLRNLVVDDETEAGMLPQRSTEQFENIVFGSGFTKLHPVDQFLFSYVLADQYASKHRKHAEAFTVFKNLVVPLTEAGNFGTPVGEWQQKFPEAYENNPGWKTAGWTGLGVSAIRIGDMETAREAFTKVLEYDTDPNSEANQFATRFMNGDYSFADIETGDGEITDTEEDSEAESTDDTTELEATE